MNNIGGDVASICLVLGLLGATMLYLRRKGAGFLNRSASANRRLTVLERVSLDPSHAIHLVNVDGDVLIVFTSPGQCQALRRGEESRGNICS